MRRGDSAIVLTLITGPNCPLCDEMRSAINATKSAFPFVLKEIAVDTSEELLKAYGTRFPYLFVAGSPFAKGAIDSTELSARITIAATLSTPKSLPTVVEQAAKTIL